MARAAPQTLLGSLQRSARLLSWIRGGEGDKEGGELGKEGRGREGREWKEGKGKYPTKF